MLQDLVNTFNFFALRVAVNSRRHHYLLEISFAGGSVVKNWPAMQEIQEMWVWSLGWEDSLEKAMVTHSSILAWEMPWTEEPSRLQSMWAQESWIWLSGTSQVALVVKNLPANAGNERRRFDPWVRRIPWRAWQPTLVFLPGESHGQRSLAGYSPQGCK